MNEARPTTLVLSESAVETHVSSIFAKLELFQVPETHRRVAAVLAFLRQAADGWVGPAPPQFVARPMDGAGCWSHHCPVTQAMGDGRERRLARLAIGLFAVALALAVAIVALTVAASRSANPPSESVTEFVVFVGVGGATPLLGVVLALRRPSNPIGWLFLAGGVAGTYSGAAWAYGYQGLVADPGSLPAADWVLWSGAVGLAAYFLPGVFALLLFPNGTLPSPRWRLVCWAAGAAMALELAAVLLSSGPIRDFEEADIANPAALDGAAAVLDGLEAVAGTVGGLVGLAAAVSLIVRYRQSDPHERRQLAFFGVVVAVSLMFGIAGQLAGGYGENAVITVVTDLLLSAGLPAAIAFAILWRGLYQIERVVNRSVVYAVLWALITAAAAGAAWAIGVAASDRVSVGAAVLLALAAIVAFEPARRALSRLADRLVFGRQPRGYDLAADFGSTVQSTGDLDELAGRLAELVCRGLDVRWARVTLHDPPRTPVVGECTAPRVQAADTEGVLATPITYRDDTVGMIECGAKLEGHLDDHDRRLVDLLANEAALAAHSIGLAASLAASRSRIVAAQEAERRRIERNIHDGAQQELVALIAKVRLARDLLARDPASAAATLEEVQGDARLALREIRELAQGIHPTVLGDQGLVQAIEDRTARLPLDVSVSTDMRTRAARYDDAVEGTAFFVVSEALTNVLKHAVAEHASVSIAQRNGTLHIEVGDDGCGFDRASSPGTGLVALADRVEALGGRLDVESTRGAGTHLRARIPVRPPRVSNV